MSSGARILVLDVGGTVGTGWQGRMFADAGLNAGLLVGGEHELVTAQAFALPLLGIRVEDAPCFGGDPDPAERSGCDLPGRTHDHYSYEAVEQLKDTMDPWQTMRRIRDSAILPGNRDPELTELARAPNIDLCAIDVSFPALKDKAEFEYLNNLPTSFVRPPEAVDRLRAAAGTIIGSSPEFQRLLKHAGATLVVDQPPVGVYPMQADETCWFVADPHARNPNTRDRMIENFYP